LGAIKEVSYKICRRVCDFTGTSGDRHDASLIKSPVCEVQNFVTNNTTSVFTTDKQKTATEQSNELSMYLPTQIPNTVVYLHIQGTSYSNPGWGNGQPEISISFTQSIHASV